MKMSNKGLMISIFPIYKFTISFIRTMMDFVPYFKSGNDVFLAVIYMNHI